MKTVLFIVETNPSALTDQMYIDKAIRCFYDVGLDISIKYACASGIDNLTKMNKEIGKYRKGAQEQAQRDKTQLDFSVVIVADTDNYDSDSKQKAKVQNVKEYCDVNGYYFVWMCKDVEHVFLKRQVSKEDKKKEAMKFYSNKNAIINFADLSCENQPFLQKRSNLFSQLNLIGLKRR